MDSNSKQDQPAGGVFDFPDHLLGMIKALFASGKSGLALSLLRKGRAEYPDDPMRQSIIAEASLLGIPVFHRGMLRDKARNLAYRQAIEATVAGKRVLDIGTGSGLLAMMAAKAGAAHVYACESQPLLAATAREIVAANGFSDRITVLF
jgi:type III protein arginine methyltransferase